MISALRWASDVRHVTVSFIAQGNVTSVHKKLTIFEEKGEPKRGVEPVSSRLPAEHLNDHQAKPAHAAYFVGGSVTCMSAIRRQTFKAYMYMFSVLWESISLHHHALVGGSCSFDCTCCLIACC